MEPTPSQPTAEKPRRPLRPLYGIPEAEPRTREGPILSGIFHALIILALILPPFLTQQILNADQGGAGGPGPAGGGGGGNRGSGGQVRPERIRFLQMVQPAPAPAPPKPSVTPALIPPPPPKAPEPTPVPVQEQVTPPAEVSSGTAIPMAGTGGGSGTDGSGGNGPGRGGGVGSGVGTGRGSGEGPGTGGGGQEIFPPTVTHLAILPIPVPNRVRPYKLVAAFDVDERGNARLLSFNPSRDSGYNRKIREMLAEMRFRPATRADGTPVRDTAFISALVPH